ncbi:unnamed protein product [Spirodela intermedia]|uniref:Cellulose synthase n=1 Tax=Spirodela intermedia TaxID=51605 RepID=A0A7I8JSZ3_SPIIN|nr:unnamed protein product [Spirodela intermedia]CAA6673298.1 unnamed protein product [Spirodela intermedia]
MDAASKLRNGPYRPHGREEGRIGSANTKMCLICGDHVGLRDDGEPFVACYACGLPVCRTCYDYERAEGNHSCPRCQVRYKRHEGCPSVPGDEDDDVADLGGLDDESQTKAHEDNQQRSDHRRQQWHPTNPAFPSLLGSVAASDREVNDDKATHNDTEWKARVGKWRARQDRGRGSAVNRDGRTTTTTTTRERRKSAMTEARQPLWRKVPIPASRINPYRIVVVLRLVVLGFFLHFRVTNPAEDAYPLWLVSVVCEIWFALSWILDQFPKCRLAAVDVFVSTVDPLKEPPIITANTVLSVLAVDYPVGKINCYVSDDGASMLLFDALSETAEFARLWGPEFYFSQKIDYLKDKVQPSFVRDRRAMKREYEEFKVRINALVAKAQKVPEEGWVYLGNHGALDVEGAELPRLVYVSREKRPGYHHHKKAGAMNALVRVSAVLTNAPFVLNLDCDHYINNSQAIKEAMCFLMDPQLGKKLCFVQFPQRFDGIDPNDRYANRNVVFFDINMRGLDGIQGPVYVGTGCVFNRQALYGYDPPASSKKRLKMTCDCWASCCGRWCCCCPGASRKSKPSHRERGGFLRGNKHKKMEKETRRRKGSPALGEEVSERSSLMSRKGFEKKFGQSPAFITSTLMEGGGIPPGGADSSALIKEAIHVISCGYEERTEWGKEIGWIYGSVTEDILTGFKMHCRGWKSAYCMPARAAFKGSAPINLSDRLHQVLRWALGSVEIFLSCHCPLWYGYGGRLKWLERLAYTNTIVYPFTSVPLLAYCTVPAVCLLTGKFIIPSVTDGSGSVWFVALFLCIVATGVLELRWSGVSIQDWWRNEQFWVIGGVSAHLFAVFQGLLKVLAGVDTSFTVTSKATDDSDFGELYLLKWSTLLIPPTTLLILNIIGLAAGLSEAVNNGYSSWGPLFGKLFFASWVIVHLYPFLKGLLGRQNRTPTVVVLWSILLASVLSLVWVRIDPFLPKQQGPILKQCGVEC